MPGFELFGEEERSEVQEVLETGVLFRYGFESQRKGVWKAKAFEEAFAERLSVGYCHLVGSGTAALQTALAALGVGAGDEIIIPPFTFVATFEAILNAGAVPVFSEIDDTLCLDPDALEAVLTPRTKAVMPVHMCGAMARIDEIVAVCKKHDLVLIEDACQSVGGTFRNKPLGTFGNAGCFSFDSVKTITCGEGGAIVTDDKDTYLRADAFSDHGHDHLGENRGLDEHIMLGSNFRISELNAAVGFAQLRRLDTIIGIQKRNHAAIQQAITKIPGIQLRTIPDPDGDTATFLTFFLAEETAARNAAKALAAAGVGGCPYWYDNNWHYYRQWDHLKQMKCAAKPPIVFYPEAPDYAHLHFPKSDSLMSRAISMQIMVGWSEAELSRRIETTVNVLKEYA